MFKTLLFVLATLFWRHMLLPQWLSLLMLNFPGILDEVLILAVFVYWLGPHDVLYSTAHFYKTWVQPKLQPLLEQYAPHLSVSAAKKDD